MRPQRKRLRWHAAAWLAALALAGASCARPAPVARPATGWRFSSDSTAPVTSRAGLVVSAEPLASGAGAGVLRRGGNAIDAAVATALALAVTFPQAGNLGGGGFLVLHRADGTRAALDFRETAPARATRAMYLDASGGADSRSLYGPLAAGVPGSVAGLWEAHRRYGRLPWAAVVEPSIRLAEGFETGTALQRAVEGVQPKLTELAATAPEIYAGTRATFFPGGAPPAVGSTFRQPELAETLRRIAADGANGFYRGPTAERIVAEMERGGGLITAADLAGYAAEWREPMAFGYRGHTILSMPPSSSGGATLAEMANILEGWDLARLPLDGAERAHRIAEAARRAFADRNAYLGDPAFVVMPVERMISDDYATLRRTDVSFEAATPSERVGPGLGPVHAGGDTTHLSVVDGEGSAVALTTTINTWFGSLVTVRGAGFLLNNEMDDFSSRPGEPNAYGLVQAESNAIAPGKRMLSSMTPCIVLDPQGKLRLVLGSPGGPRITTAVAQVLLNVVDLGADVATAVRAPRVHHQHLPDRLFVERGGLSPAALARLERMGHRLEFVDALGEVQAIAVLPDGTLAGAADPRGAGLAVGL